jgi:protein SCO1/2
MSIGSTVQPHNPSHRAWLANLRRPALLWSALLIIPVIAIVAFAVLQPVKVRPRIGLAPGFVFTDQNGNQLTSEDLRGKFALYNFTYTRCAAPCAQTSATMRAVQEMSSRIDTGGIPLELVTISFDPTHDTPETLTAYATEVGADPARWHFVTGKADRLKDVIGRGFSVYYAPDVKDGFTFDPVFVLVDGNGIMRAIYETATPDLDAIVRDIKLVVDEVQNSTGAGKLVYEAAHLFLCYPKQ